jgi:hypothetical protein
MKSKSHQMEYFMPNTTTTFEDEELHWPPVQEDWNVETLLKQKGMFKFAKIKGILNLKTIELTRLSKRCKNEAIDCYKTYGFAKPRGSQYVVRMSVFRKTYRQLESDRFIVTRLKETAIQNVPGEVEDANQLISLTGCFRLGEVCHFSPFREHYEVIKTHIRRAGDQEQAMNHMGAWYDKSRREYFVRMEVFHKWFLESMWVNPDL